MHGKVFSASRIAVSIFALGLFLLALPIKMHAEKPGDNFVYVMTNRSPENSIVQFSRGSDGSLTWVGEVPTGGSGSGPNGADPLGSQDSLVLSGDGLVLLAVNAGSNELSVLGLRNGQHHQWNAFPSDAPDQFSEPSHLVLLSKTASGGTFPNSVTISGDLVYVLNSGGTSPNITGFRLDTDGVLHWIATADLPAGSTAPNDIRFAPDGSEVLVAVSGTNQIIAFPIGSDGVAGTPVAQSAGGSPFGIRFGHNSEVIVSDAVGAVSSYQLSGADMLTTTSAAVSDTQNATCWISVPRDGSFAFASNTGSGTLSSFAVDADGTVSLLQAVTASPGGAPIDSTLSRDGKFLYVDESAQGKVLIFAVNSGSLTQIGLLSLTGGIQGIAGQ